MRGKKFYYNCLFTKQIFVNFFILFTYYYYFLLASRPSDLTEERVFERESYRSSNRFDLPDEDGYTLWSDQVFLFGLPLEFIMNQTNFIIKRFNSQDGVVRNHNCTHQIAIK